MLWPFHPKLTHNMSSWQWSGQWVEREEFRMEGGTELMWQRRWLPWLTKLRLQSIMRKRWAGPRTKQVGGQELLEGPLSHLQKCEPHKSLLPSNTKVCSGWLPEKETCRGWKLLSLANLAFLHCPTHLPLPPFSWVEAITPLLNPSVLDSPLSWDPIAPMSSVRTGHRERLGTFMTKCYLYLPCAIPQKMQKG